MFFDSPFNEHYPRSYRITNALQMSSFYAVEIGYCIVPPDMKQRLNRNFYILHYVTKGKGVFCEEHFDDTCGFIILPNESEYMYSDRDDPYETYWIMFQGEDAVNMLKSAELPLHNGVFRFSANRLCAGILRHALFDIRPRSEPEEAYIMQSALYQIFAVHAANSSYLPQSMVLPETRLKKFIEDNYFREIHMKELAQQFGYSPSTMFNSFKKAYNVSPLEYLLTLRIEKSKQLLSNKLNDLSIGEIARIVGFNDPLYFSRVFRKKTGITPSQYLKEHNDKKP